MSRAVILRKVIDIDQMFKVANRHVEKGKIENIRRLMKWFYFGFKQKYYLYNSKMSSVGQELPNWWEMHLCDLQRKIATDQFMHQINIGVGDDEELLMVPCVEDSDSYNFDHVPVWYEPEVNNSWGPKYSGLRNMRTGVKEKFRITVVLTISKCGKKLIPFIIFKGMALLFTIDDIFQMKTNISEICR